MSTLEDILGQLPIDQIAERLGVDPQTAQTAVAHALPALLGGLHANAQDPAGAAKLADAVAQHDPSLVENGVNLDDVDTADGAKIVNHVFGGNTDQVVNQLASSSALSGLGGMGGGLVAKVLPMLAPIVMAFLAKQFLGGGAGGASASASGGTGGGLAGILGSLLGGGAGGAGGASLGGIDLSSILGGLGSLLGGGTR